MERHDAMPTDAGADSGPARQGLGWALWAFAVFESLQLVSQITVLGMALEAAGRTSFAVVDPLPDGVAQADIMTQFHTDMAFIGLDALAVVIGLTLIFRRHPRMRAFWLVYLCVFCLVQLARLDGLFSLATGLAWLAYWVFAPRPRQLQLSSGWQSA